MATGSAYPSALDSWTDKSSGDFLTVADVNARTSAIEKLETGPLYLNDGSSVSPAYAFRSAGSSGMYYAPATQKVGLAIGGVPVFEALKQALAVNYLITTAVAAANAPQISPAGTDTNISLVFNTKGTGSLIFDVNSSVKGQIDNSGRFFLGTSAAGGSGNADMIIAYGSQYRMADSGGSTAVGLIGLDASNRVTIAPGGTDIVWGRSLIALGAGAVATLGQAGGPVTSTQNSWMRVVDNGGAAFWVPVWK